MNEFDLNNINEAMASGEEKAVETPQPAPITDEPDTVESSDTDALINEFEEQALIQEIEEKKQSPAETPQQVTPPAQPAFQQQQAYQQPQRPQPPYQPYPQYQRPVNPQTPYGGGYAPRQNTNPYVSQPYVNAPQQQVPQGYYNPYPQPQPQPKQKMSGGLKALIIIVIAILTACVIGFTAYLAFNYEGQKVQSSNNSNNIFGGDIFGDFGDFGEGNGGNFGIPDSTSPTFTPEQSEGQSYDKSDASDKTNPHFKGIELEKKPKDTNSEKYNASYTYNAVEDAVVGVACYYEEDKDSEKYQSQGTGIIITSDGYVVTNSHVIGNSRKAYLIKVITADKKEYDAGVVGYDSRSDLAVLKIEGKNLPVAKFGDSAYTEITEEVVAIGNPSGIEFQNSVTKGIVSALDREVSSNNNVEFIQIDAAINPGNSGGPLCNMYGQVIGINTAKIASESYEGMGFAIPSATVKKIVDDIIRNSYVTNRVKVGITGKAVYESEAGADGIQIMDITKGGPMDGTGAQKGDIITEVDGEKITTFAEIFDVLEKHKEGDKVKIKLYRPSENKTIEIKVKLQMDKADQ